MDSDFIHYLIDTLKRERVLNDYVVRAFQDEVGKGFEFIAPSGERLRLRYVPISLSPAELATGLMYPGGVQVAVILPDDRETDHTINIPLHYVSFLNEILSIWADRLVREAEEVSVDLSNAHLVKKATKGLMLQSDINKQAKKQIKEANRDVI